MHMKINNTLIDNAEYFDNFDDDEYIVDFDDDKSFKYKTKIIRKIAAPPPQFWNPGDVDKLVKPLVLTKSVTIK